MRTVNRLSVLAVLVVACLAMFLVTGTATAKEKAPEEAAPTVQLAILLDTSNSMDGLINQAKTQLWTIVGEFTKTKLAGKLPKLQVALYEYGNDSLVASEGYVRQVVPLTDDLDKISEALFALDTNGGEEYCGKVILTATQQLDWSKGPRDLRCIFIAGNEEFTQGNVDYKIACKAAADRGITISTIFCGDRQEGIDTKWEDGAKLADGSYLCINADHRQVAILTPHDKELAELSAEMNRTYLAYGDQAKREKAASRQEAQDTNAAKSAINVAAQRAGFKASGLYKNSGWDLVDAVTDGTVKLEEIPTENLPEVMQPMSPAERAEYLQKMTATRKAIAAKIQAISAQRDDYVAKERARLAAEAPAAAEAAAQPFADAVQDAIEAASGGK